MIEFLFAYLFIISLGFLTYQDVKVRKDNIDIKTVVSKIDFDRKIADKKLQNCQKIIRGKDTPNDF